MAGTQADRQTAGGSGGDPRRQRQRRRRQAIVAALAILALIVAAFLAPPLSDPPNAGQSGQSGAPGSQGGGPGGPGGPGSGQPGDPDGEEPEEGGEVVTTRAGSQRPGDAECVVSLSERPTPGQTVEVSVRKDGEPVTGRTVWFNGERVGQTNQNGVVSGRVPYDRSLRITVALGSDSTCTFVGSTSVDALATPDAELAVPPGRPILANLSSQSIASEVPLRTGSPLPGGDWKRQRSTPGDGNVSGNYTVAADVDVAVRGRPIPGKPVVVEATISGAPMRNATVSVDGERVGQTDASGNQRITVPDRDQMTVRVTRGDFAGQRTVEVDMLETAFRPQEGLPWPGERVVLAVGIDGEPVRSATVTVDGERYSADRNGTVAFALPADPTTPVRVSGVFQWASPSLWAAYAPTLFGLGLLAVVGASSTAGAYRLGRQTLATRLALGCAVLTVTFVAVVAAELVGLLAVLTLVGAGVAYRLRHEIVSGGETSASLFAGFVRWAWNACRSATRLLERAVERGWTLVERVVAWAGRLPRSASGLAARLWAWLRTGPRRLLRFARTVQPRVYAAGTAALASVAAATYRFGGVGFFGSVTAVAVCWLCYYWWQREEPAETTDETEQAEATPTPTPEPSSTDSEASRPTLRELWRRFARRVAPASWRYRTPGEVSREAVDEGFPQEQVRTLASAFRDVEYGERPLSDERYERATEAFEELQRTRHGEGDR